MYAIGADVGGSHISSCLFEHSNKVMLKESLVVKSVNRNGSKDEIISDWADALLLTSKTFKAEISGVGFAMPGPFDYYHGVSLIKGVDKFESLYKVNIRTELSQRLGMDAGKIRFINDASAFTIAETSIGDARHFDRCVGITLGTGFGSCFVDKSQPVLKRHDVPPGGFLYDKPVNGTIADDVFSTRGIISAYQRRTGKLVDSVRQLALKAADEDAAKETFTDFGKQLGLFLAPYLQTFDAKIVVLGGNISGAYHLFGPILQQTLPSYKIYVSAHGERAAMIGAARLLDDEYYKQIKDTLKDM